MNINPHLLDQDERLKLANTLGSNPDLMPLNQAIEWDGATASYQVFATNEHGDKVVDTSFADPDLRYARIQKRRKGLDGEAAEWLTELSKRRTAWQT